MNEITPVPYKKAPERRKIKELYISAFPKHERMPWWILRILATQKDVEITGYYKDKTFCGFTYTITAENMLFVLYFAVNNEIRGKGYGSVILGMLKQNNPDKTIFLNIEPLDEGAENYNERVRRFNFYKKNGFYDTGLNMDEVGGTFRVLSNREDIDEEAFCGVFEKLSQGLWKPKITKAEKF